MSPRLHRTQALPWTCVLVAHVLVACGGATALPELPSQPRARASAEFWERWGDGRAELLTYRGTVMRYGQLRPAELVLIYVTEPLDRATLIKDDQAPPERRLPVLKLNAALRFQTGIYPYSVMTSVFAPVDSYLSERFSPVKVTMTAQEWCGHVYSGIWPGPDSMRVRELSYFASEGERDEVVALPTGALFEDALLIQLRELDGPFAGGERWSGALVPAVWRARREHVALRPAQASIERTRDGEVNRFTLRVGERESTFEVEADGDRRIRSWRDSEGESMELVGSQRLPYWQLNHHGEEAARERIGLPRELFPGSLPSE